MRKKPEDILINDRCNCGRQLTLAEYDKCACNVCGEMDIEINSEYDKMLKRLKFSVIIGGK